MADLRELRERLIEHARYVILTGGTDRDVVVAERIVERFIRTLNEDYYIKRRPRTSPTHDPEDRKVKDA